MFALDPELRHGEAMVALPVFRVVEVDHLDALLLLLARCILEVDRNAIAQQAVEFAIGGHKAHRLAPVGQPGQRLVDRGFRYPGVQP